MNDQLNLYACSVPYCGYIYNPDIGDATQGIASGIRFADLPHDWKCPKCKAGKCHFDSINLPNDAHHGV